MTRAYVKLCDKARCCVDWPPRYPAPALALWERLGTYKARRGYTLELVAQIVEAQREEDRQPQEDITSSENRRRLDALGKEAARFMGAPREDA